MAVIERILQMTEEEADSTLAATMARFSTRYRDLGETLERNFGLVAPGWTARSGWRRHGGA